MSSLWLAAAARVGKISLRHALNATIRRATAPLKRQASGLQRVPKHPWASLQRFISSFPNREPLTAGKPTYSGVAELSADKLLIFGRYPRRGQIKTRLASYLTDRGCYQLHIALLLDTIERTRHLGDVQYLYLEGCTRAEAQTFVQLHSMTGVKVGVQRGSDLGERMWQAYTSVGNPDDRVVFLGSDSPSVPLSFIRRAFEALTCVSCVLGPAEDGGYFLLGLSKPHQGIFQNIPWGSPRVFQETLVKLCNETYEILPKWYDIDVREDLFRLASDLGSEFEGYPRRTRSFLEERGIPFVRTISKE